MKYIKIFLMLFIIILLAGTASATEENITFTTTGSSFAPIINVTGSPTILWTFSDGTTSTSLRPSVSFGSSATRTQTLKVTPWNSLTLIDLGYAGADGGATPSNETIPDQTKQYVSSITGLENVAPSLVKFAACGNPITSLDFSNFVELTTVECFYSGLTSINLTNTPKLDRVCVENSDLSVVNVTDSVILGDLRVAAQNHGLDSLILPATISCWHLCCRDNTLKANVPLQNAPNLTEVMVQNANQSGELHPSSTKLTVLYANNNSYTSANISGCFPSTHTTNVRLQYNKIEHIDLTNCAGITGLQLQYNQLNQSEVDYVLHTLDGFAQTNGFVYLEGNTAPSSEGLSHANNLTGRHWTIKLDTESIVSNPAPNFSTNVSEGEAPLSVQFTDLSENANVIAWDFNGDGIADSTERNPVYEFATEGIYTVNLTATNGNGTASKLATINVTEKPAAVLPIANFSANVTSGYVPLSVQFNDTSTGLPTSWEWNFGDGSTNSTEQNPNHTYNSAGTYTVVLNVSNTAGHSINHQTNYITTVNNNNNNNNDNSGSLTLVDTNFSQSSSIPRGMYIEANVSNVTLTYNSILKCADITYVKTAPGWMYFTNLYPTTDSNITYTLGTEGVSSSSYVNIVASNSLVSVFKLANGDYKLSLNWIADNKSTQNSYITVPAASIVDNKVTFSLVCYESNRTNMLKYNDTIYTKTPFRTMNTRNQNYVFVNQPMVYFSSYLADKDTGPYVVHVYSIKQEIPRKTVTPYGTRSLSALTITYPDPENNGNGINLMKSNGQKSTVYVDISRLDPDTVSYEKELLDAGWEMGIHYTQNFNTISNETAIAAMDSEYNTIVNTFGRQPKTWVALASSGNISQAIYAYQRYGMIWRSCESGASWLSAGNLCNPYWKWWNTSIAQGIVFPAFTIATDKEPVTGSSINASYFTMFSNGFAANNIRLCGLHEYYFTQSAQNTTQVNITDSNESYMRFTVNTGGYPCTLNVMTNMSNVEVSHDGVSVPYTSADDGIVFTATDNTTYELRSVSSSLVANFTSNLTSGNVPFTVQFNDTSTGSRTSWDWNFGDGIYSNIQNATHTFTTAGLYHVTLTASKSGSSSTITKDIIVSEKPAAVLPAANFSTNVTEGFAPLSVQFNDSSENANSVNWDFNSDGISDSTERNPIHEFATQGNYIVNLAATNGNGTDSKSAIITVSEKPGPVLPVANFSSNVTEGHFPLSVQFNDLSENETEWNWNFGDGANSTEQSPIHIYDSAGNFSVNLTVSNQNGTDSKLATINVLTSQVIPPQSICEIQSSPESTWINWTWTNPDDPNFDHTEIYLNGTFQVNTSAEYFNATDLQPETDYTIGTRTADIYWNANETWVNASAKTKPLPEVDQTITDLDLPVIESVMLFPANTTGGSKVDVSAKITDNIEVAEVTAGDVQLMSIDGSWRGSIAVPSSVGKYSLLIRAKDSAGNTVNTSVPYSVIRRKGGTNIEVLPTASKGVAGENTTFTVKVKNTQNIDDTFKVQISVNGLPAFYRAGDSWFSWTEKTVNLRANEEVLIPVEMKIPASIVTGLKVFRANVNSEKFSVCGSDIGYLVIPRPRFIYINKQTGPKGL